VSVTFVTRVTFLWVAHEVKKQFKCMVVM